MVVKPLAVLAAAVLLAGATVLAFFSGEIVPWVEKKFPQVGGSRQNRAVLGWSNGGVFAGERNRLGNAAAAAER